MKTVRRVVLLIGMVGLFALCGCATKTDVSQFVNIEVTGANGYGTATASIKTSEMEADVLGVESIEDVKDLKDVSEALQIAAGITQLQVTLDKEEKLSNGDVVKVTVTVPDGLEDKINVSFQNTEFEYTVSGLEDAKQVDLWKDVTLNYSGDAENGYSVEVVNPYSGNSDEFLSSISYSADPSYGVVSGQAVTVTASCSDNYLDYGYVVDENAKTKEYTVDGVDSFVNDYSQIDAQTIGNLKEMGKSVLKKLIYSRDGDYSKMTYPVLDRYLSDGKLLSGPEWQKTYFRMDDDNKGNEIYFLYKYTTKDEKKYTVYTAVRFGNIIQKADGAIYYDKDNSGLAPANCWSSSDLYSSKKVSELEMEIVTKNEFKIVDQK